MEHHLCCLKVGVSATAQAIFDRLNQFFEEHGLDWTKCKSVTTDGAAAMQDSTNKVIRKIKNLSPEIVSNHRMIHQVALVLKKFKHGTNLHYDLAAVVDDVTKIVNSKKHQMFSEQCKDMDADVMRLLYHAEVRWLSREKVSKCVFKLWQELYAFLAQHKHPIAINDQDNFWLAKLSHLCSIFICFVCFICHFYPPFTRKQIVSLYLDGKSALAWELPFSRFMGHLSST